ncbi:F0F1 ATP synthase subunit A [Demequina sp. TTPB684]|uniref:F0F1 ATP synthase subunit A n=1 Tax=unclassified Demequina TaxID=2620311 RepID=UPI001CF27962|nr:MULTISPECIES: F0F1 ATP synthase subunit A [unclassified Demequina]MCB2411771.1 F0F1 ATP synthase subunit A [Demequina sp. TTPB684]UPU88639.1 F0F1 ATP synthase subunit A [Demequina sp. TMPB413]
MRVLNLAATVLTAADDGNAEGSSQNFFEWLVTSTGFHPPSVEDFNPDALLFGGTIFEFNRITLVRVVAAVVMVGIVWLVARRATIVPTRGQAAVEMALDFVRVQIAEEVMGAERARKYVPFLTTLFIAIVFFNITGVVPLLNIAGTSLIGLPIIMALWVYVMYLGAGVRKHGLGGYLRSSLFPPGVPWPIYFLLTPIEALQIFFLRPATLALRLAANMIAGHLMLVLTFSATHFFLLEATGALKAAGAVSLAAGLAFTLFEIFVALLQAYVFVMLATVYLNMSLEEEH